MCLLIWSVLIDSLSPARRYWTHSQAWNLGVKVIHLALFYNEKTTQGAMSNECILSVEWQDHLTCLSLLKEKRIQFNEPLVSWAGVAFTRESSICHQHTRPRNGCFKKRRPGIAHHPPNLFATMSNETLCEVFFPSMWFTSWSEKLTLCEYIQKLVFTENQNAEMHTKRKFITVFKMKLVVS